MNIGFDVDGVIFPIEDYQINTGIQFFKKNIDQINLNGYGIKEVFDCSSKQEVSFWLKNSIDYNTQVIATPGIKELIDELRMAGNKVYIVTSRAKSDSEGILGKCMRKLLFDALKRNKIIVDGIHFTSTENSDISKAEVVKKYNIHIMVDDRIENLIALKGVTKTICFTTRCNSSFCDSDVFRANSAKDLKEIIYDIISGYENSFPKVLNYKEVDLLDAEGKDKYFSEICEMYRFLIDKYEMEVCSKGCKEVRDILQKLFNLLYRPKIIYPERFPTAGGVILAANHLHSFDPLLVMQNSKLSFRLLAKEELRLDKKFSKLFCKIGSIFVDNSDAKSRAKSKEELVKTVLAGGVVMMFPEGTRNRTNQELLTFHMGTVSVAQITGVPVIPVAINADYRLLRNHLCSVVGKPIYVGHMDNLVEKNNELRQAILDLKKELYI